MTDRLMVEEAHVEQYMKLINDYRSSVFKIQSAWDNLSLLAQLSGIGTDMTQTRDAFGQLTSELISNLSREVLNKTLHHLDGKASVIINLIVRNLFERTADIGFLATDVNICDYLMKHVDGHCNDQDLINLKARFLEYIAKYSVYSNIILLDTDGAVLLQLDESSAVVRTEDSLVKEALTTNSPYVEVYRHTDLLPNQEQSLVYAYRISAKNSTKAIGVLCLCFRFENEMEALFDQLIKQDDWTVGVILDSEYQVIASSDRYQIPLRAKA